MGVQVKLGDPLRTLRASGVVFHDEALYQVYVLLHIKMSHATADNIYLFAPP